MSRSPDWYRDDGAYKIKECLEKTGEFKEEEIAKFFDVALELMDRDWDVDKAAAAHLRYRESQRSNEEYEKKKNPPPSINFEFIPSS